jgi:hypothetical protein
MGADADGLPVCGPRDCLLYRALIKNGEYVFVLFLL